MKSSTLVEYPSLKVNTGDVSPNNKGLVGAEGSKGYSAPLATEDIPRSAMKLAALVRTCRSNCKSMRNLRCSSHRRRRCARDGRHNQTRGTQLTNLPDRSKMFSDEQPSTGFWKKEPTNVVIAGTATMEWNALCGDAVGLTRALMIKPSKLLVAKRLADTANNMLW